MLCSFDIYRGTRTDTPPDWPRGLKDQQVFDMTDSPVDILRSLDEDVFQLFVLGRAVLSRLEDDPFGEHTLDTARLDVHHGLLSYPKLSEHSVLDSTTVLLCVCRTAGLIFSDMVLYPMPYSTGISPRLAEQLLEAFIRPELDECWLGSYQGLLIWAAVLGAIAATRLPCLRRFFLKRLAHLPDAQGSWHELHTILTGFLWWEPV